MTIEESDFRLKAISEDNPRFDLELLYIVNKGKKNERTEFKNSAYGLNLENAIKRIAHFRVENKHENEAITLLKYFKEFKKELDDLKKCLGI